MRKTKTEIAFLFAAWAASMPVSAASPAATAVKVTPAIPESGDSAGLAWEKTKAGKSAEAAAAEAAQDPVYLVKVYVDLPPAGAGSYRLWVGDDEVREYGSFKRGLYFKVYDPGLLAKWAGKPLRMGKRGQTPQPLGQDFPQAESRESMRAAGSPPAAPARRPSLREALAE